MLTPKEDAARLINNWKGEPLLIAFFLSLQQPMMLPHGYEIGQPRPSESIPWDGPLGRTNFVDITVFRRWYQEEGEFDRYDQASDIAQSRANEGVRLPSMARKPSKPLGEGIPKPSASYFGTTLEIVTPVLPTQDRDFSHAVSVAFDRCLEELSGVMTAYQMATDDVRFRPITRRTCPVTVPFHFRIPETGLGFGVGEFLVHEGNTGLPFAPEEFGNEQIRRFEIFRKRQQLRDPLHSYSQRRRSAGQSFRVDGDWSTAIVSTYTACEVLCNTLILSLAWEEGLSRETTLAWFGGQGGFMSRIRARLVKRLGGDWDESNPKSVASLIVEISNHRNRIVHVGELATEAEAKRVLICMNFIEDYIKQRLAVKRNHYPRTTLSLLGIEGLERRKLYNGKIRRWFDATGAGEPEYTGWFRRWLEHRESDN